LNVKVVVDKDNTHFSYDFYNVKEPINDRLSMSDPREILIIKNMNNKVISVFKEWSLWKVIE
jgi:hypothetical protein